MKSTLYLLRRALLLKSPQRIIRVSMSGRVFSNNFVNLTEYKRSDWYRHSLTSSANVFRCVYTALRINSARSSIFATTRHIEPTLCSLKCRRGIDDDFSAVFEALYVSVDFRTSNYRNLLQRRLEQDKWTISPIFTLFFCSISARGRWATQFSHYPSKPN